MNVGKISNLSFRAKANYGDYWDDNKDCDIRGDIARAYDSKIEETEKIKQKALELYDFMESQAIVNKLKALPDSQSIRIGVIDEDYRSEEDQGRPFDHFELMYTPNDDDLDEAFYNAGENDICKPELPNGELDKDAISSWLDRIITFNKNYKDNGNK